MAITSMLIFIQMSNVAKSAKEKRLYVNSQTNQPLWLSHIFAAPRRLQNESSHGLHGIVVQLRQPVVWATEGRENPTSRKPIGQASPFSVEPDRRLLVILSQITWTVHTWFFAASVISVERLEHRVSPRPLHHFRCGAREGFSYRSVLVVNQITAAKKAPRQGDGICIRQRRPKRG